VLPLFARCVLVLNAKTVTRLAHRVNVCDVMRGGENVRFHHRKPASTEGSRRRQR
jgi:hypothetical protein